MLSADLAPAGVCSRDATAPALSVCPWCRRRRPVAGDHGGAGPFHPDRRRPRSGAGAAGLRRDGVRRTGRHARLAGDARDRAVAGRAGALAAAPDRAPRHRPGPGRHGAGLRHPDPRLGDALADRGPPPLRRHPLVRTGGWPGAARRHLDRRRGRAPAGGGGDRGRRLRSGDPLGGGDHAGAQVLDRPGAALPGGGTVVLPSLRRRSLLPVGGGDRGVRDRRGAPGRSPARSAGRACTPTRTGRRTSSPGRSSAARSASGWSTAARRATRASRRSTWCRWWRRAAAAPSSCCASEGGSMPPERTVGVGPRLLRSVYGASRKLVRSPRLERSAGEESARRQDPAASWRTLRGRTNGGSGPWMSRRC